jgi:predicted RNA-binding Zn-ribbon protein involved in translation (DUF1610 family)
MQIYLGWEAFWATGRKLFGEKLNDWKFQCPQCGHVTVIGKKPGTSLRQRVLTATYYCEPCGLTLFQITVNPEEIPAQIIKECPHVLNQNLALSCLKKPHSARVLRRDETIEYDSPIIDFYRTAETGERARATGIKNTDELRFGDSE